MNFSPKKCKLDVDKYYRRCFWRFATATAITVPAVTPQIALVVSDISQKTGIAPEKGAALQNFMVDTLLANPHATLAAYGAAAVSLVAVCAHGFVDRLRTEKRAGQTAGIRETNLMLARTLKRRKGKARSYNNG